MNTVLPIYKPAGLTPLQAINILKDRQPEYEHAKITYAGRLDPLAHGVLLLLIGEEAKNREEYLALPKTYEFEVLFGLETDSYDVLGLVKPWREDKPTENVNIIVNSFVHKHIGKTEQPYPPFSSKTVHGKPLFQWAKEKKLHEITIPHKEIEIYEFVNENISVITTHQLQEYIRNAVGSVHGDFRQEIIMKTWEDYFAKIKQLEFQTAKFRISCSSGTYVRGLAHALGRELGTGAIALDIKRTAVGDYTILEAQPLAKS